MNAGRRMFVRLVISAVVPLAVGCGGGRDAGGAQPKPAAPVASGAPAPGQPMHWSGHIAAGKAMEVRTISGTIHVTAATGDVGEIEARVHDGAPDSAPTVRFTEDEHGVVARVETREHGCDCDGHNGRDGHDGSVDFDVRVPAGVRLIARAVHGGIDVDGVSGPIDAHTVDGGIAIRSATSARARTVNGSVTASFRAADLDSDCELETVNGPVQVTLPAAANAELVASTLNGEIHVGFPFTGSTDRRSTHGSIGHGGRELRLRTINGTIDVSRGS